MLALTHNSKDDNNYNVPIYHAAPPMWKCYNIDASTESFFWNLGPLSYLWAYEQYDCGGEFATLAGMFSSLLFSCPKC